MISLRSYFLFILFLYSALLQAQQIKLSGVVRDEEGEVLSFANVLVLPDSMIVPADGSGAFAIRIPSGHKNIIISYTGYLTFNYAVELKQDTLISFVLSPAIGELDEVTINANRYSQEMLVRSIRTGTTTLTKEDVNAIPVLGGEADIIKTLQLLPGTVRGVEGSSDLFVRGGAADQNLVLLDGATVYNTSHLFGFLSVFNPDILEKVEAIKGGFPAEYGGRLSSILDISSGNRVAKKTEISGNIGLIASRLYVEQPLVKNKLSVWVAGRRTYIDRVIKVIDEELPYYFYDFNGKLIFQPGPKDHLELSHYTGKDILDIFRDRNNDGRGYSTTYKSGNSNQSLLWRHETNIGWKSTLNFTRSAFLYDITNAFEENKLKAFSDIEDYSAKLSFEKNEVWHDMGITTGLEWIRHDVSPNVIHTEGNYAELIESSATQGKVVEELAAFVQQEVSLTGRVKVSTGLRTSWAVLPEKTYFTPEPRVSLRYSLNDGMALKLSYSRMAQYMHRISNSAISSPTDIWYPVTDSVHPQKSHQVAIAWQKFLRKNDLFISAEAYYKSMEHLIGYEEGTNLFLNTDFESKLIQGKGRAYGVEFLLRKEAGKLTGWLSYTLAWSDRQFDTIEEGDWFKARYDRRHNGALVLQYKFQPRIAASLVWEYISGARFTPVIGQYINTSPALIGVDLIPVFSEINAVKLADTHRLDLGLRFMSKPGKNFSWYWFIGVNNVYNRANPIGITIVQDETDNSLKYEQPGLFGLLPFISYGFKF